MGVGPRPKGCPWDDVYTCANAAEDGQLAVLQWARANGCPWNEDTCAFAARGGQLVVLEWARANGCPCVGCVDLRCKFEMLSNSLLRQYA